jgi:uncharacterized membrane protein
LAEKRKRIHMLDEIRGFAIICMIVHHIFLDVGDVLNLDWGYSVFDALCTVQPVFWAIFIIISGMCTRLSRNATKRGALVFGCAMVVTIVTALIMPLLGFYGAEIYFGILHCLGICMIITGLLMPVIKKIDYRIGAVIAMLLFIFFYGIESGTLCFGLINLPDSMYQYNFTAPIGLHNINFYSADYFPIIPWIFMFLFGAFVGKVASDEKLPQCMYKRHSKILSFVGKNSLWVYLAHQPVIYLIMIIISLFIS